jgi:crotonobetaine/carnitine-CoA ligase
MVPNSLEAFYVWLGASWLGAIEVPLNTGYRGQMLTYVANHCEAKVAVISERYVDRLERVAEQLVHLERVIVPDATSPFPALPFEMHGGTVLPAKALRAEIGPGPDYYDIAAMIYTSGTTGPSKGVLVPWAQLYHGAAGGPTDFLDPGRSFYLVLPAFHVSGKVSLYLAVDRGGWVVMREGFSPGAFWSDVHTYQCQVTQLVGPMAAMLMAAPPRRDDSASPLQSVAMYPLIAEVEAFKSRFGVRVWTGYGMTEVGSVFTSGWDLVAGSCGRRRPTYQVRIVDDHDEPVATGQVGELVVRCDQPWLLCAGYWRMGDATAAAWRNGWFHTGDAFWEDADGNFYFVDRMKDAIRRRGENVASFEVEAGLNAHPAVLESAVVAVPSELGEDDVKAVIVLRPGARLQPAELIEWLIPRMPRFMIPRYVEFADAIPKTEATLRAQKAKLRADPISESTWDRDKAGIVLPR